MILVILGTQDKPFVRLLNAVEQQVVSGAINEEVIVQAGNTKYSSDNMQIMDLIPMDELKKLMSVANLIITHGGVGSIIDALKLKKRVIVCPRLQKYGEHINDHQIEITENCLEKGYICVFNDGDDLGEVIEKARHFTPNEYVSNTGNIVKIIEEFIDKNI